MSTPSEVFARVVDGMDLGIVLTDAGQKISYSNAYALRLFGIELVGRPAESMRPLITSASPGTGDVLRGEVLVLNEPLARQSRCYLNIAPLSRDEGEAGLVWTFFELTEEIANTQAFIDFSTELTMKNRELRRKNDEILVLSRTDPLTGLANRDTVLEILEKALTFGAARGQTLSVALFDVDRFRSVSDEFGHSVGDQMLRHIAFLAAQAVGQDGTLGRCGGDEFLIVLPGADLSQARALAEAVRVGVQKGMLSAGQPLTVTVGVAQSTGKGPDAVLSAADKALARGKEAGRNLVMAQELL